MQNDINNPFLQKSEEFFSENEDTLLISKIAFLLPSLVPILVQFVRIRMTVVKILRALMPQLLTKVEELPGYWIMHQAEEVVSARIAAKKSSEQRASNRIDLLQLMVDAMSANGTQVCLLYIFRLHSSRDFLGCG